MDEIRSAARDWHKRTIVAVALAALAQQAVGVPLDPELIGVEVVTNDIELIDPVRAVVGFLPKDRLALSDPRLTTACERVRQKFTQGSVNCTMLLEQGNKSLYIVQLQPELPRHEVHADCGKDFVLGPELRALVAEMINNTLAHLSIPDENPQPHGEFVNSNGVLDYTIPSLHKQSVEYHRRLANMAPTLRSAAHSCISTDRAASLRLTNFVGDPTLATELALLGLNDEDIEVRNNALRLASAFTAYFSRDERSRIFSSSCNAIKKPNFFDRNKGLMNLLVQLKSKLINPSQFPKDCTKTVDMLARTSISDQIGGTAKMILAIQNR